MPDAAIVANSLPLAREVRAFFAPIERTSSAPADFDPAIHGMFPLEAPPVPWINAGLVRNLSRTASTSVEFVRCGSKAAPGAQFRRSLGARVEFDFTRWGKLQMALSGGSQHFNVLARDPLMEPVVPGGHVPPAARVLAGSTRNTLFVLPDDLSRFGPGDLVAVDEDYNGQTGYIGHGIAGAFLREDVVHDPHYLRRVTFNVARIAEIADGKLHLAQPLLGGDPPLNAGVAKVVAFSDRESGSFFSEWSALFVLDGHSGGRVVYHYPRLQVAAPAAETCVAIDDELAAHTLHASFIALPVIDPLDGEEYVTRRVYLPQEGAAVY